MFSISNLTVIVKFNNFLFLRIQVSFISFKIIWGSYNMHFFTIASFIVTHVWMVNLDYFITLLIFRHMRQNPKGKVTSSSIWKVIIVKGMFSPGVETDDFSCLRTAVQLVSVSSQMCQSDGNSKAFRNVVLLGGVNRDSFLMSEECIHIWNSQSHQGSLW